MQFGSVFEWMNHTFCEQLYLEFHEIHFFFLIAMRNCLKSISLVYQCVVQLNIASNTECNKTAELDFEFSDFFTVFLRQYGIILKRKRICYFSIYTDNSAYWCLNLILEILFDFFVMFLFLRSVAVQNFGVFS